MDVRWYRLKKPTKVPWPSQKDVKGVETVHVYDPTDADLLKETQVWAKRVGVTLQVHESPLFVFQTDTLKEYRDSKQNKIKSIYNHKSFYVWARKKTGYLMEQQNEKKIGSKWSYDTENRKPLPDKAIAEIPEVWKWNVTPRYKRIVREAWDWACTMFPKHYGPPPDSDVIERIQPFALTTKHAECALSDFVKQRLSRFGTYEDAVPRPEESTFVYHSNLSHCLNNGLLSPKRVIEEVERWYHAHPTEACLAQAEGCIRQILGWREFTRMAAVFDRARFWKSNGLQAKRKVTHAWYDGSLGCPPVDSTIHKAFDRGYLHHIERLMIMSNYMTLNQIHPRQMYKWFMEFSMDSYDWVMILNVFAMGAHADTDPVFTKPYISSSNYIKKMTNYKRDSNQWQDTWDRLYYSFLQRHKVVFSKNVRMNLMMSHLSSQRVKQLLS